MNDKSTPIVKEGMKIEECEVFGSKQVGPTPIPQLTSPQESILSKIVASQQQSNK